MNIFFGSFFGSFFGIIISNVISKYFFNRVVDKYFEERWLK